ncbi:hypothetical protein ACH4FX_11990 [Streptomyces sp. NPDC018019]|uniref:hypothetical protein n=1 Tax=Streptomyces sp. NPDC018019 TaxID=3365030 RepID=UPI0037B65B7E
MAQRQLFCPYCDHTSSLGSALNEHVQSEHPPPLPAGAYEWSVAVSLGSSVECGYYDNGEC